MAKARIGLYTVKGDTLTRTHRSCPKCGPGTFLAQHKGRQSCGHCGYSEAQVTPPAPTPAAAPAPRGKASKSPAAGAPAPPTPKT